MHWYAVTNNKPVCINCACIILHFSSAKLQKIFDKCKYIIYILQKFSFRKDNLSILPVMLSAEMMLLLVFLSSFSIFFFSNRACAICYVMYCKSHSANKLSWQVGSIKWTFIWNGFIQGRKSNFCYKYADKFLELTKLSKLPEHIFENLKISWQNSAAAALKSTAETDIDIVDYRKMA